MMRCPQKRVNSTGAIDAYCATKRVAVPASPNPANNPATPKVNRTKQNSPNEILPRTLATKIIVASPVIIESFAVLQQCLRLGFALHNILGNELQQSRAPAARQFLPPTVPIVQGDALDLELPSGSFDIVFQSLVFSSILDDSVQAMLVNEMWKPAKSGGGILWYDLPITIHQTPTFAG